MIKSMKYRFHIMMILTVIMGMLCFSSESFAQSASAVVGTEQIRVQQVKDNLPDLSNKVCGVNQDENSFDIEILQASYDISDVYDRVVAATADSPWAILSNDSSLGKAYTCAQAYINHVASVKKRQARPGESVAERIIASSGDCWPCNIAFMMIDSIQQIASVVYTPVSQFALILLGVMLMFWLAFRVLFLVGKFGYANNAEFFTDLLYRFIAVTIAAVLLSMPILDFYRITVSPLIGVTASLGSRFSELAMSDNTGRTFMEQVVEKLKEQKQNDMNCDSNLLTKMTNREPLNGYDEQTKRNCCVLALNGEWKSSKVIESCWMGMCEKNIIPEECAFNRLAVGGANATKGGLSCSYCADAMDSTAVLPHTSSFTPVLDDQTINALLCLTCTVYKQFTPMVEAGGAIFQYAAVDNSSDWYIFDLPDPFMGFFLGLVLMILFGMLTFIIAFRIIDIFLRFGFVIILTPLLITAWAFPISRQYAKKGWDFIVGNLLEMLGIAVAGALIMSLTMTMLPDSAQENLITAMAGTDIEDLYNAFTGDVPGGSIYTILVLIMIFFVALKLLSVTQKLMENISGISLGIPPMSSAAAKQMLDTAGGAAVALGGATGATDAMKGIGKSVSEGGAASLGHFMSGGSVKESIAAGHAAGMKRMKQTGHNFAQTPLGKPLTKAGNTLLEGGKYLSEKSGATAGLNAMKETLSAERKGKKGWDKVKGTVIGLGKGGINAHNAGFAQSKQTMKEYQDSLKNMPEKMKQSGIATLNAGKNTLNAVKDLPRDLPAGAKFAIKNYMRGRKAVLNNMLDSMSGFTRDASGEVLSHTSGLKTRINNISNLFKNPKMASSVASKYMTDQVENGNNSSASRLETLKNVAAGSGVVARSKMRRMGQALKHPLQATKKMGASWKNAVKKIDAVTGSGSLKKRK